MTTANKDKINEYIAPTVLVLVIFDDVYEIHRALNILAKKEGVFPKELVVIHIGTKTIPEIVRCFTYSKRIIPKDENLKNYFTRVEINKSKDEDERKYDKRYIAKDDFKKEMEKDFFNGSDYEFPLFTEEHIKVISPEFLAKNQTALSEKIQEIYAVVRKREIKFNNISFKLPFKSYGINNRVNDVEVECAKLSQYLKFSVEQEKTIIDATKMTSYKVDMVCDENTIHLCVSRLDDKLLLRIAFLMGRISRKHDLTSIIDSEYHRDKRFGGLDEKQDTLPFDEAIELLPRYVKEFNTQLNFLPIERASDNINKEKPENQDVKSSKEAPDNKLNKADKMPRIKFYTKQSKEYGTVNRPRYFMTFNDSKICLSLKCATFLYTWLTVESGMLLEPNKELGFIKAQNFCKLLGAKQQHIKNEVSIIKFITEKFPSQMQVIIGKANKGLTNIKSIDNKELHQLLDQEQIGGYLGGKTESNDKNEFIASVTSQIGIKDGMEWLSPKNIHKILTSKEEFEMVKATYKTVDENQFKESLALQLENKDSIEQLSKIHEISTSDYKMFKVAAQKGDKNDLVKFLILNDETWDTYKKIIKKHSYLEKPENVKTYKEIIRKYTGTTKKPTITDKPTNPRVAKEFVSALIDYEIIDKWLV